VNIEEFLTADALANYKEVQYLIADPQLHSKNTIMK
jgi:hypothetical protein